MEITQSAIGSFGREMRMRARRRDGTAHGEKQDGNSEREGGAIPPSFFHINNSDQIVNCLRPLVTKTKVKVPLLLLWHFEYSSCNKT